MAQLVREIDWAATPLGPPNQWSPSLRMMVSFLLANRFPLLLWWGPEYIQIYNDAYRPILGTKHPQFLGRPVRECWSEVWHILRPLIDTPFQGGPATWMEDFSLEINRHGFIEESHFTIAYSPVPDETVPSGIGGVLATVHEITEKVIGQRRVGILSELGARLAETQNIDHACATAMEILSRHRKDVPFALLYLVNKETESLKLVATTGHGREEAAPAVIAHVAPVSAMELSIAIATRSETMQVIDQLESILPAVPSGPWSDPPTTAAIVPIKSNITYKPAGALLVGISSRSKFDTQYASFLELVGSQIATAIARARAYEEEHRRAAALAELDRAKTAFFSNVSHEFRTPLTLMLGPLQDALADSAVPPSVRNQLEFAHRNALRLLKLVNSLLDFVRIEAGHAQVSFEPVDFAALTADLASNFRSAMEQAGIHFHVDCPPLDSAVYVDREMWEKIVLNLLSNAFKFTFQGHVRVHVRGENSWAVLEVEDTGVGVPDHEVPRLFERFHRVQGTHGRTHEGSGIGLALVEELVKQHGGNVGAKSSQGQGTTFTVRIPFGADHLPQERLGQPRSLASTEIGAQTFVQEALRWLPSGSSVETPGPGASSPELAGHRSRFASTLGSRIVLADDNADMRDYLQALLQPFYEVEAVGDGEQALESIRRRRPALVLSDVMMPKLDGFGFLKVVRADPALHSLPVILLTARAGEESRIEGLDSGADDYLIKPFAARELLARVGSLVERSRVQQELEAADMQKNEFLAMLAHELRNPLAPIRNAGELLSRTFPGNSNVRAATSTIERQVTHLSRMVDDLLDISRITQGRIELRMKPVAFSEVISRGIEVVGPVIQQKRHRVTFVSSRRPLVVNGDPERLVQCISNVLTNAAKYTDPRGEIHVEESERDGEAVVTITDNGAGIPADLLPRIFDLFVQGDRTLDRAQGGLGIGLSIVKRVMEMHRGKIVASSDGAGRGSTFEIRLPLMEVSATLPDKKPTAKSPARRILVVDDNADAADSLTMVLGFEGHEVLAVYTGLQAIEHAERFKPDVMLIDIGLPDLDGYEVARRIRAVPAFQSICLVAVTGYGQDADKDRARAAGFSEHLVKPIEFPTLDRVLTIMPRRTAGPI